MTIQPGLPYIPEPPRKMDLAPPSIVEKVRVNGKEIGERRVSALNGQVITPAKSDAARANLEKANAARKAKGPKPESERAPKKPGCAYRGKKREVKAALDPEGIRTHGKKREVFAPTVEVVAEPWRSNWGFGYGKPARYNADTEEDICKIAYDTLIEGKSLATVAFNLGISRQTLQDWRAGYERFAEAVERGLAGAESVWCEPDTMPAVHPTIWKSNMANRFDWRDKNDQAMTVQPFTLVQDFDGRTLEHEG